MFDPKAYKEGSSGGYLDQAGVFLVVFTAYKGRDTNHNGNEFLNFKAVVIDGLPQGNKGKTFTQRMFITEKALGRLAAMCMSMGWSEPWDPQSDTSVKRVMLMRPFKARMTVEENAGKKYARIAFSERETSASERDTMDAWVAERMAGEFDDASGDTGDADDEAASTPQEPQAREGKRGSVSGRSKGDDYDAPPPSDDNIPF